MDILRRIKKSLSFHINDKLFYHQWILGFSRTDIRSIIKTKQFDPDITWLHLDDLNENRADPFLIRDGDNGYSVFYEKFFENSLEGSIWHLRLNDQLEVISDDLLMSPDHHISYPFIFNENGTIYIIPETASNSRLSVYEYNRVERSLQFRKHILDIPILDATFLKTDNKYWLFGVRKNNESDHHYESWVYTANDLLGEYTPHPMCPVKKGLKGTRAAGNFIEVDGTFYRPTQNCEEEYGKSIILYKIDELTPSQVSETDHMSIALGGNGQNAKIKRIHTINVADGLMVVDGVKRTFSLRKPYLQFRNWIRSVASSLSFIFFQCTVDAWEWVVYESVCEMEMLYVI